MITPEQCRMARAALQIGVRDLAQAAGVASMTVSRFENGHSGGQAETLRKIQTALEQQGIEFIEADASGAGPGVRIKVRRDPYSYFPFAIFEMDMPFGKGRFGVYRDPAENPNRWSNLTLLQLAQPIKVLKNSLEAEEFWIETLNTNNTLALVLSEAMNAINGPRKPSHPSDVKWYFYQPVDVYPGAPDYVASLPINWDMSPPQIDTENIESSANYREKYWSSPIRMNLIRDELNKVKGPFRGQDWTPLDPLDRTMSGRNPA